MNIKRLKKKIPYPMKQGLKYLYGVLPLSLRYGREFSKTYAFLQKSQWWNKEQLENYQMRELEKLLNHAYENVPYYRKIFDERRLKPNNIQSLDDLKNCHIYPRILSEKIRIT
jgi:phenylacetate-CoA ligase